MPPRPGASLRRNVGRADQQRRSYVTGIHYGSKSPLFSPGLTTQNELMYWAEVCTVNFRVAARSSIYCELPENQADILGSVPQFQAETITSECSGRPFVHIFNGLSRRSQSGQIALTWENKGLRVSTSTIGR